MKQKNGSLHSVIKKDNFGRGVVARNVDMHVDYATISIYLCILLNSSVESQLLFYLQSLDLGGFLEYNYDTLLERETKF